MQNLHNSVSFDPQSIMAVSITSAHRKDTWAFTTKSIRGAGAPPSASKLAAYIRLFGKRSSFVVPTLGGIRHTFRLEEGLQTRAIRVSSRHGQKSLLRVGLTRYGFQLSTGSTRLRQLGLHELTHRTEVDECRVRVLLERTDNFTHFLL